MAVSSRNFKKKLSITVYDRLFVLLVLVPFMVVYITGITGIICSNAASELLII